MKSHRVIVTKRGGPDVLQVVKDDVPEPGSGEVRVKVQAAGVSAYDLMLRSSWFPGFPRAPFTPGVDVVGVADKLGESVSTIVTGQTVASVPMPNGGGYSEYVCLPADELAPVPPGLDPAEAVCLIANYLTAHVAMYSAAAVQSGESVLIHGAAGGVGTALLELGRLADLEMFGTASLHNHELVSDLGGTPIDYRSDDFVKWIRNRTGDGVDVVFDPIGGAGQVWRSNQALRKGGRLVWFGMAATTRSGIRAIPYTLVAILALKLKPDGKQTLTNPDRDNAWYRETLVELLDLLAQEKIKPIVAQRIPLAEAASAHALLERGGHGGRFVLVTD